MKKIFLFIIAAFIVSATQAQKLNVTVFGGFSNYQGDLQDKRFTLNQAHLAFGAGLLYDITDKFGVRANVTFGKVSGDDKYSQFNNVRNFNFQSQIMEVHLGVEYDLLNSYRCQSLNIGAFNR